MWYMLGMVLLFNAILVWSMCKSGGDADREYERLYQEKMKIHR